MPLKDINGFFDTKLEEQFKAKPYDPERDRQRVVQGIARTRKQFGSKEPTKGRKWWSLKNGVVYLNTPFGVSGYVKEDQFDKLLTTLEKEVKSGTLDEKLRGGTGTQTRKRAGWSKERREAYERQKNQK